MKAIKPFQLHVLICYQFLRLTHAVPILDSEVQQQPQRLWIPFHFNVPTTLHGLDNCVDLGDQEGSLPPSLSLVSDTVYKTNALFVRGECNISYYVTARLITTEGKCAAETRRQVTFIPTVCSGYGMI